MNCNSTLSVDPATLYHLQYNITYRWVEFQESHVCHSAVGEDSTTPGFGALNLALAYESMQCQTFVLHMVHLEPSTEASSCQQSAHVTLQEHRKPEQSSAGPPVADGHRGWQCGVRALSASIE